MDELNSNFGRLSTSAAEWKPAGARAAAAPAPAAASNINNSATEHPQSDLRASKVKEFVPGQAWASSGSNIATTPSDSASGVQRQQSEIQATEEAAAAAAAAQPATVPSGPSPPPAPTFRALHSLGLGGDDDNLWRYHRDLALESIRQMDPTDERHKAVPLPYCNAYCLDDNNRASSHQLQQRRRSSFGYPSTTFQVVNREDGHVYCLRRFDNVRSVSPKIAAAVTERWNNVNVAPAIRDHPGLVCFYQCFVAQRAVFFVHQYIPGARSLQEHFAAATRGGVVAVNETVVWSCVAQLVSALRVLHANQLASRTLDLQHILATSAADDYSSNSSSSRLRVRINCLGIVDALEFETRRHLVDLQTNDIRCLGRLVLSMATGSEVTASTDSETIQRCEAFLVQNYSRELHNLAMTLIKSTNPPSIMDISRAIAQRCMDEQDAAYRALDRTEQALAAEYESGRALRLLLKLGFINERPEFGPNRRWAQSGDCYVLTLFRDFVFHQADGAGNPVMDLGHVITALNKLDAASEEEIVLASRDGKSLMVVSYADVARCLENAFHELVSGSVPPAASVQY